jgi:hypothetical protein
MGRSVPPERLRLARLLVGRAEVLSPRRQLTPSWPSPQTTASGQDAPGNSRPNQAFGSARAAGNCIIRLLVYNKRPTRGNWIVTGES